MNELLKVDNPKWWLKAMRMCRKHLQELCGINTNSSYEIHSRIVATDWMYEVEHKYIGGVRVWYDRYYNPDKNEVRGQQLRTDFLDWLYPYDES